VDEIFTVISKCNRSTPHQTLVRTCLEILLNLARFPSTSRAVYKDERCLGILMEVLKKFSSVAFIFVRCMRLLLPTISRGKWGEWTGETLSKTLKSYENILKRKVEGGKKGKGKMGREMKMMMTSLRLLGRARKSVNVK